MSSTQQHLVISDIKDGLILLKDGSVSMILKTQAVNFGLLSEDEQVAIIYSFAATLNSLSFPIQIVIRSKILDVSSYLEILNLALNKQNNPLLVRMTKGYINFVQSIIKINQVLDKQFYVCFNVTNVEIGLFTKGSQNKLKKALTILSPRRDHLINQLLRIGLTTKQLTTEELIRLFYDIYNVHVTQTAQPLVQAKVPTSQPTLPPSQSLPRPPTIAQTVNDLPLMPSPPPTPAASAARLVTQPLNLTPPFVVEELTDDYGY